MPTSISASGVAFMLSNEGWSDYRCKGCIGTIGTDAQAGCNSTIDKSSVITVGPGLTNALNNSVAKSNPILDGKLFTASQIAQLYKGVLDNHAKLCLKHNPTLGKLSQNVFDMACECMHSGIKHWLDAGWANVKTAEDAATCCSKMPQKSKGKVLEGLASRRRCEAAICLGKKSSQTKSDEVKCNQYYNPSGQIGNFASQVSSIKGGELGNQPAQENDNQQQEQQQQEDPNKNAGLLMENTYANAYGNILSYNDNNTSTNIRRVKHTRIYALFTSTIVLDEMSMNIQMFTDNDGNNIYYDGDEESKKEYLNVMKNAGSIAQSEVEESSDETILIGPENRDDYDEDFMNSWEKYLNSLN